MNIVFVTAFLLQQQITAIGNIFTTLDALFFFSETQWRYISAKKYILDFTGSYFDVKLPWSIT